MHVCLILKPQGNIVIIQLTGVELFRLELLTALLHNNSSHSFKIS